MSKFVPRNSLVAVAEIKSEVKKTTAGVIVPNATSREYKHCEVVAVGRGMATQQGERSLTDDLVVGQQVLVKLMAARRIDQHSGFLESLGVEFKTPDGRDVTVVEQSQIVAIIAEPGESRQSNLITA